MPGTQIDGWWTRRDAARYARYRTPLWAGRFATGISGTHASVGEGRSGSAASGLMNGWRLLPQSRSVTAVASREKPAPWVLDFTHSPDHSGAVGGGGWRAKAQGWSVETLCLRTETVDEVRTSLALRVLPRADS
jgi:hypothetical protein